jgi:hypothetical protein
MLALYFLLLNELLLPMLLDVGLEGIHLILQFVHFLAELLLHELLHALMLNALGCRL